jgi:hypothetical protein
LVLLIDQLEEIFTAANITQAGRERFVAALDSLARSEMVWIIATLRSDFIGRLSELPVLVRLIEGGGEYRLLPPTREELGQMIRAPALSAGLRFEKRVKTGTGLDDLLRDEALDDPMGLPLLEFALEELFHRRELLPDGGGGSPFAPILKSGNCEARSAGKPSACTAHWRPPSRPRFRTSCEAS